MRFIYALQFLFLTFTAAAPAGSATSSAPAALSTACGDVVNSCNTTFTAKQVYDCLISVPFNPTVATRFIKYYNDTLQFHSTLAYLKTPPASYQQPAVDLIGGLSRIQRDIEKGVFSNQYAFEATLQNLIYSSHDAHLRQLSGILEPFTFASPYSIVSLSEDGIKDPKVYVVDDSLLSPSSKPSAIKTINGQDVTDFLSQYGAANSYGHVEPHADWNDLMSSYVSYIKNDYSIFEYYTTFYPGETITVTFENGTQLGPEPWLAYYDSPGPTGPLTTGGDFYNFFVLGFYPASFDENAPDPCDPTGTSDSTNSTDTSSSGPVPSPTSWAGTAFPDPADIVQPNLYPYGGGFVTGYYLRNISTAVLSIPTFKMSGNDTQTFSDTVGRFLKSSNAAGMKNILIDLQTNAGGSTLLAVDTYKHFFPLNDTFRGSRLRAHPTADILGNTFTDYFSSGQVATPAGYRSLTVSPWVGVDRLNVATGENFTSWGDYFGPHPFNGDTFTSVHRENITSAIFDEKALGIDIYGAVQPADSPQFYAPENIAILTDGLCSSACAVFVEMMHHDTGVKTVTVGGMPHSGPMQAVGGSRGAQLYSAAKIDKDIQIAKAINSSTEALLPDRSEDVLIDYISINLRDQIRKDENTPVQFLYDAADCRIYYTTETWSDYAKLWTYASNAIFRDSKLCVAGSTGYSSTNSSARLPPPNTTPVKYNSSLLGTSNSFTQDFSSLEQGSVIPLPVQGNSASTKPQKCDNHLNHCPGGAQCVFPANAKGQNVKFNGRTIVVFSGTCPVLSNNAGGVNDLLTKQDEPGEIRGSDGTDAQKGGVRFAIIA